MKAAWTRWLNFWFAAGDPTTMSLIRIVTGCVVLYVHLAYYFDLTSFFGTNAWVTLDTIDRERKETPAVPLPLNEWEWEYQAPMREHSAFLPLEPHRRVVLANWLRNLPWDNKAELGRKLRLIDTEGILNPGYKRDPSFAPLTSLAVRYANTVGTNPEVRANAIKSLLGEIPPGADEKHPEEFKRLSKEQLRELAANIDAFASTFPTVPIAAPTNDEEKKFQENQIKACEYIAIYFADTDMYFHNNLLRFIANAMNSTESARKAQIDYLEYWNIEKRKCYRVGVPIFSLWFHITDPVQMYAVHTVIVIIIAMFTLGFCTRITSVLTWLAAVSYLHRNQQVLFGQDTMMNILLIYLLIAHSGGALSLDRWLACRRAKKASLKRTGTIDAATQAYLDSPPPSVASGFAQRCLQIHFCFIYMASGLSKLKGNAWWNHNAFWDTLVNPEFTLVHYDWYQQMLRETMSSRPVFAIVAAMGVGFTLFIEIAGPFLFWTRLRPYAIMLACMLHAGIGIFMGLLCFSLLMMTMLVSYLPGSAIREQLFGEKKK